MTTKSQKLRDRTSAALQVLHQTRPASTMMEIVVDERSATAVPLVLASMDTAEAIYALLINQPEQSWAAALQKRTLETV